MTAARLFFFLVGKSTDILQNIVDISLHIEFAIPLGLLINELVSNSLKNAFPGGRSGDITFTLEQQGKMPTARISDDGGGMTAADRSLNRKPLGLEPVHILAAHHLDREFKLLPEPGTGYRVSFLHSSLEHRVLQ